MELGRTAGRGLESPAAPYLVGAIILIALVMWLWFKFDIRRHGADRDDDNKD